MPWRSCRRAAGTRRPGRLGHGGADGMDRQRGRVEHSAHAVGHRQHSHGVEVVADERRGELLNVLGTYPATRGPRRGGGLAGTRRGGGGRCRSRSPCLGGGVHTPHNPLRTTEIPTARCCPQETRGSLRFMGGQGHGTHVALEDRSCLTVLPPLQYALAYPNEL